MSPASKHPDPEPEGWPAPPGEDLYSRAEYRRMVAWDARIRREGPFLERLLDEAPERSVVDLGCGTGEHVAFFAGLGLRAVGIDRSASMMDEAKEYEAQGKGRFFLGDVREARSLLGEEPPFGLALSLGNTLPHLLEESELRAFFGQARDVLLPGGLLLVQILNYTRILERGIRSLPLNIRAGESANEEIVFLRLMKPLHRRRMLFFPTTLVLQHDAEEPVRVKRTQRVELCAWTAGDLVPMLGSLGFTARLHGDMEGAPYVPGESSDLVMVATRGV